MDFKFYILQGKIYYILFFKNPMRNHSIHKTNKNKTALGDFLVVSEFLLFGLYHFMRAHECLWGNLRDCVTHNFEKHWSKCLGLAWIPSPKDTLWQGFESKWFIQEMIPGTTSRRVGDDMGKKRQPIWDALMCRLPLWATGKTVYNIPQSYPSGEKRN